MVAPTVCYLNIDGKEEGPIAFEDVIARLGRGEIHLTDYMFNEILKDWVPLLEVTAIQEYLRSKKPTSRPNVEPKVFATSPALIPVAAEMQSASALGEVRDWFVLKWDTRIGPFSTLDLVHMLQEKTVYEFEFIWKQGMVGWKRLVDIEDFQSSKIRQLFQSQKAEVFIQREHARVPFQNQFMAHDGSQLWQGKGHEISSAGARVQMSYAALLPGQVITLHMNGSKEFEAFNVQSEIVGKKFRAGRLDRFTLVEYVVKFIGVDARLKTDLKSWIAKHAA